MACVYHVNNMASKNQHACPGPVRRRPTCNWRLLQTIGLLFLVFQRIDSKHVSELRLGRRSLGPDELIRGLNTEALIPDGLRVSKAAEARDWVLGDTTSLDKFDEFQEGPALGTGFKNWFRDNRPVAETEDKDKIEYDRSELRAAWYIYLKSKNPELYSDVLGNTNILEAIETKGDRFKNHERTMYAFLDQVFGTDGDESAAHFIDWMEQKWGRLERHRYYNLKSLYDDLLEWIEDTKDTTSLDEFPKKRYYAAWAEKTYSGAKDPITQLMNKEIYPLADVFPEKSIVEPLLPKGSFENAITPQKFKDFLIGKASTHEIYVFENWLSDKHSLVSEYQFSTRKYPRQHLTLNFVKWVNERSMDEPFKENSIATRVLKERKKNGVDAANLKLLNQFNEYHPLDPEVPLDLASISDVVQVTVGKKRRLNDQLEMMGLQESEKEKFMSHILESNEFEEERKRLLKGQIWNLEDLKSFHQKWKGPQTKENSLDGSSSVKNAEDTLKEENEIGKSSGRSWQNFRNSFKDSAKRHWYKVKDFYQAIKDWFKRRLHLGQYKSKPIKEE